MFLNYRFNNWHIESTYLFLYTAHIFYPMFEQKHTQMIYEINVEQN